MVVVCAAFENFAHLLIAVVQFVWSQCLRK